MRQKFRMGFTLIELLVVVAIIGILATIVILNLTGAKNRSRYARVVSDMTNISTAVKSYEVANNNSYPLDVTTGAMPSELTSYLSGVWPATPCSGYRFDYENWSACPLSGGVANGQAILGIHYDAPDGRRIYRYDLKDMGTCPVATNSVGADILTISPKEITCHE